MNIIGIDVSKQKLDCVLIRREHPNNPLSKQVENSPEGIVELLKWATDKAASQASELHSLLEATGPYHEVAASELYKGGSQVTVVNPAHSKHFAQSLGIKTKTDQTDAKVLAQYGLKMADPLACWQPPSVAHEHLKTLQNRKQALQKDLQREQNRLEKQQAGHSSAWVINSIERMINHLKEELTLV